ncbi:MAG: hypothetical protein AAB134_02165 [Pseudomonadota bacterium]
MKIADIIGSLRTMISTRKSTMTAEDVLRETAAMVYVGDIYAVHVHNRVALELVRINGRPTVKGVNDAVSPFLR